jgi:hypothetical protein
MNITIKPLTPELSADYFDFFENRAFTDNSPYRCYCQPFQMTKEQEKTEFDKVDGPDVGRVARKVAERQIDSGILRGYLAFSGRCVHRLVQRKRQSEHSYRVVYRRAFPRTG